MYYATVLYLASRSKLTLRRLRSRTVSLFSKDTVGLPRGGGGGGGGGERGSEAKKSPNKTKETGSTLPRQVYSPPSLLSINVYRCRTMCVEFSRRQR